MGSPGDITRLLHRWSAGDTGAGDELSPLIYDELRRISKRLFRGERQGHTLQATALVHEAYAKLVDVDVAWQDRAHFFSLAARMMRRLLVNHATGRNAQKRGGDLLRVTMDEATIGASNPEMLELDEALTALAEVDAQKAELIELQYFGGLSFREMEEVTGRSSSSLDRDLRLARAWLKDFLSRGGTN